ncbi:ABC transporter ATP-binding protein [Yinghuangia soli]|uniref:ABC transporter ATP-binding protein/permease n=1 Tax=Yinghuangia soli TaxID=2908204 RepID=A0AA41PZN0_9ACTN|nr:ABC transporter ATP-binding protein [Yinghuangia soli]MCF2527382.1 ABC transporter ATP-binding protein/permease [Yinghuangia soli]
MGSRKRRRDQAAETIAAGIASGEELFGGSLEYDHGYRRHIEAHLELSLVDTFRQLPRLVARSVRLAARTDRNATLVVAAAELGQGLTGAFSLLATNEVLVGLFAQGPTPDRVRNALPALIAVAVSGTLTALLRALSTIAAGRLEPKVERAAEVTLMTKVARVEMEKLEDGDFKRLLQSASWGTDASRQMVGYSVGIVNALISLAAASVVLTVLHPVLLPLLFLITLPQAWGAVRDARRRYRSTQAWIDHNRQQAELAWHLRDRESAQEVRVHGVGRYLLHHYRRMAAAGEAEAGRLARAEAVTDLGSSALSGLASLLTYLVLGWLVLNGHTGLAASGTAVLAIRTGTGGLGRLVTQVQMTYRQSLYLADYERACVLADEHAIPEGGVPVERFPDEIALEEVSYTYADREKPAVDAVSLTIRRGQIVALVGENGSGKTTLAKLIAGLYRPQAGRILWDGTDDGRLDRDDLFRHVALVSQSFTEWPFTAAANIAIGRPRGPADSPGPADLPGPAAAPQPALVSAAEYAEADAVIDELPKGWRTLLDRSYVGGVALSGGQWQRMVLARARFRDAALVIADEPTSALDARSEIAAFAKIRELADRGQTVILITHRLASTRLADRIFVLDHGRLTEQGSHPELMASGGGYAEMYTMQAAQYADGKGSKGDKDGAARPAGADRAANGDGRVSR